MLSFRDKLAKNYVNYRGWTTKRHIVVIESDDWGSIRTPSKEDYNFFLFHNIAVDKNYFDKNDCLENCNDLAALFEVLTSVKDCNGNYACITPCSVVANPDFQKIEESSKNKYYIETLDQTYQRYPHTEDIWSLWQSGIKGGFFYPQFHGREHVNVRRWMNAINTNSYKEQIAFERKAIIAAKCLVDTNQYNLRYFPAFDFDSKEQEVELFDIAVEGLKIFERLFGFKSVSFVPCCGICSPQMDKVLADNGVSFLQRGWLSIPQGLGKTVEKNYFWGHRNEFGQLYWRRNCTFEPARNHDLDWVDHCMQEINIAFRWGKPAVINSHRVNFIGSIFPENRDKSLAQFKQLLKTVVAKWPDVEFMNSEQLSLILKMNK